MNSENSQSEYELSCQNDEQVKEQQEQGQDMSILNDVKIRNILQTCRQNIQPIFELSSLTADKLCQFKNKAQLMEISQLIDNYLHASSQQRHQVSQNYRHNKHVCYSFTSISKNWPLPDPIIYVIILPIQKMRSNIIVHSATGNWLAYIWKFQNKKKVKHVLNILKCFSNKLVVIIDKEGHNSKEVTTLVEKSPNGNMICYIFDIEHEANMPANENNAHVQKKEVKYMSRIINKKLHMFSYNLKIIDHPQLIQQMVSMCSEIQSSIKKELQQIRGITLEQQRNLLLDFIFFNVYKVSGCAAQLTILKIRQIFIKKMQEFQQIQIQENRKKEEKQLKQEIKREKTHEYKQSDIRKPCIKCKIDKKSKKRLTSFKCQVCSQLFEKQIYLCMKCFQNFHDKKNYQGYYTKINQSISEAKKMGRKRRITRSKRTYQQKSKQKIQKQIRHNRVQRSNQNNVDPKLMPSVCSNIVALDSLIQQQKQMVSDLCHNKRYQQANLYLSYGFELCLRKMKYIAEKYPEFNTGITRVGAKSYKAVQQLMQPKKQKQKPISYLKQQRSPLNPGSEPIQIAKQLPKQKQKQKQKTPQNSNNPQQYQYQQNVLIIFIDRPEKPQQKINNEQ